MRALAGRPEDHGRNARAVEDRGVHPGRPADHAAARDRARARRARARGARSRRPRRSRTAAARAVVRTSARSSGSAAAARATRSPHLLLDELGVLARHGAALELRRGSARDSSRAPGRPRSATACSEPGAEQRMAGPAPRGAGRAPRCPSGRGRPWRSHRRRAAAASRAPHGPRPRSRAMRSPCARRRPRARSARSRSRRRRAPARRAPACRCSRTPRRRPPSRSTSPASSSRAASAHAQMAAADAALHVEARRARRGGRPRRAARAGARSRRGPTVSVWPLSSSVRPPPVPRATPITFARPGATSSMRASTPAPRASRR